MESLLFLINNVYLDVFDQVYKLVRMLVSFQSYFFK